MQGGVPANSDPVLPALSELPALRRVGIYAINRYTAERQEEGRRC